jgi:general secretion pathway protein N
MTRIRLRTGPAALFGAMLLVALIVFLPLRLALGAVGVEQLGLSARRAGGTVWGGSLTEARVGALALGDLRAHLSPWPLFVGRARIELEGPGTLADRAVRGAVTVARHAFGVDDLTAGLAAGTIFQPVPVTAIDLDGVSVRFVDGECRTAEGRVRATLGPAPAGVALPPQVAGAIRCDGGALLVPLTGQAGAESVTLRVEGNGRYRAELTLPADDPAAATRLAEFGFVQAGSGWRLAAEGRF